MPITTELKGYILVVVVVFVGTQFKQKGRLCLSHHLGYHGQVEVLLMGITIAFTFGSIRLGYEKTLGF